MLSRPIKLSLSKCIYQTVAQEVTLVLICKLYFYLTSRNVRDTVFMLRLFSYSQSHYKVIL
ncbi:hypothetical protein RsS62_61870 [Rhizobium dioscoreae]|nr:hypothetical protein RsS62_61870 [Rhizobium dioscoreae]